MPSFQVQKGQFGVYWFHFRKCKLAQKVQVFHKNVNKANVEDWLIHLLGAVSIQFQYFLESNKLNFLYSLGIFFQ